MATLLQVTEREITRLSNHELRPILNELLLIEARRYGIPASSVEITSEDNVGDDGIDARIEHTLNVPDDCRIPMGLSVWQYKAGETTPSAIKSESQKSGVQAAISRDGSYCFVVGQSYTDPMRRSREAAIDQAFKKSGKAPKRRLFTAAEIAEWVSDYPVIATQLLQIQFPDEFYTFERWENLPESRTKIEFQPNESREKVINGITNLFNTRSEPTSIRLIGADGSGKTRLILEAIRSAAAANLTFYALTPEAVPDNFFSIVEARTSIHRLILVVDECDNSDFRNLWQRAQRCNGRVILITIGSGEFTETGEREKGIFYFSVDKLGDEAIRRVIHLAAPSLHPEVEHYIARIVDGYVKLATALAESISQNQDIDTTSRLLNLPQNESILRSLWKTEEERDAMYALSLLRYIGLDDDAEVEGQVVAKFLNLDFGKLKRISTQMQRRGLVIKRGRFRYVTPSLLAVWFAKELWEAQGNDIISDLLPQLPSLSARYRILERLGDVGDERFAVPLVEGLFGRNGELADINALDDNDTSKLFYILTNASPSTCTEALERIFRNVSHERLLEFKKGRRQIIYALEGLLRRTETFYPAARILLKLAGTENETWGNNASGIWRDIFYTRLGLSPFPAWERHSLIQEAISPANSLETRLLGVKAIQASLSVHESSAYGTGPGGHLSKRWQPQVWDDIWKTFRSALTLLDQGLKDTDEQVAQEAISTFIASIHPLITTPLKNDVLGRVEKLLQHPQLNPQKKQLINALDHAVKYEAKSLSQQEIDTLQQWRESLLGSSYHDRLHRWVSQLNASDQYQVYRDKENPIDLNEIITNLANEGYNDPTLLLPELEWLVSSDTQYAGKFAFDLGRLDTETFWLNPLLGFVPNSADCVSAYLYGRWVAGNQEIVETLLDTWVQANPEFALSAFLTIRRLDASDQQAKRIIMLVRKGWLPLENLAWLEMRAWLKPLSENAFVELLQPLVDKNEPQFTAIALGLISDWLPPHKEHSIETARFIVSILDRVPYDRAKHGYTQMGWYHWQEICVFYLRGFTEDITKAATQLVRYWDAAPVSPEDERIFVLREALRLSPNLAWSIIGDALLAYNDHHYWPSTYLDLSDRDILDTGTLIEAVELPILLKWVENNKPLAAQTIAQYIEVEKSPLPTVARELLIRYGDDEIIRHELNPQSRIMAWWGSRTDRLKKMLEVVRSWHSDENETVRIWASEIADGIEKAIRQEKPHEDEDDLLYR